MIAPASAASAAEGVKAIETPDKPANSGQRLRSAELNLSYTNHSDFYARARDSGPVINRISNPGLHLRVPAVSSPATPAT